MTARSSSLNGGSRTVVIHIPGLAEGAFIGAGCCVVSAEDAIRAELGSWPGVIDVSIDTASARATVVIHGDEPDPSHLSEAVESIGFPAAILLEFRNQEGSERDDNGS